MYTFWIIESIRKFLINHRNQRLFWGSKVSLNEASAIEISLFHWHQQYQGISNQRVLLFKSGNILKLETFDFWKKEQRYRAIWNIKYKKFSIKLQMKSNLISNERIWIFVFKEKKSRKKNWIEIGEKSKV